ncbi:MAG: ATP-binding protein [Aliiglaciecola sp.]|uniref:ATP-binding protein n=1 Tax=Aliiglaciecola sp. TaxID=1872441 RepID=UPI003298449D
MEPLSSSTSYHLIKQLATVYFTVDKNMRVSEPSSVLAQYLSEPEASVSQSWHGEFFKLFEVVRPNRLKSFESIVDTRDAMVLLTTIDGNFAMRGQFVTLNNDNEHVVFTGAPWLAWMNTNKPDTQMMMSEFKAWDPQLDQLMLLSTEKQNIADLQQLTRELKDARDKAEHANQVQADFFAIMSHEMRTPLTGVVTALDLIDSNELSQHASKIFTIAKNSAENLRYVIDHVLDYSKLKAGGFENQKSDFNLHQMLLSAMQIIETRAHNNGNKLSLHIDDNIPPWLHADFTKIRQVLINLLSNAAKFTENGCIDLSVSLDEKHQLQISVSDTGRGIPLDIQPVIFQPFQTFDVNKSDQESGTGLGLNISLRLTEIMGGKIDFESKAGRGSRFFFTIPIEFAEIPAIDQFPESPTELTFEGHVLLVEDNKINQYLSRILLEEKGLSVDTADDGQQAIDKVNEHEYDLVLMDISMPVLDGVSTTEILRQKYSKQQLPIVALTAHVGESYHNRFRESGMDGILNKPIDRTLLNELLTQWLPIKTPPQSANSDGEDELLSLPALNSEKEYFNQDTASRLQNDIGEANFIQVIHLILEEITQGVPNICSAHADGELLKLADYAHSIRSNADSSGCLYLGDHLAKIETAARTNRVSDLKGLIEKLPDIADTSVESLSTYLKTSEKD